MATECDIHYLNYGGRKLILNLNNDFVHPLVSLFIRKYLIMTLLCSLGNFVPRGINILLSELHIYSVALLYV